MHSIGRVLVFSAFLLTFLIPGFSQPGAQDKETAKAYFEVAEVILNETKAIDEARDQMITAADLDTTFIQANFQAGDLILITIGKERAVKYFLRVYRMDPEFRFDIEYLIGRSYQHGLEFDKAIEWYNRYKDRLKKKSNYQGKDKVPLSAVERDIYECQNGKEFINHPGNFSIINIGREINSEYEDYGPVFNEAEDEIVFTSRRREDNLNENVFEDNKPFEDMFISRKRGGTWEQAKNIGTPVNTLYHESNLALSADGGTLYIYRDENGGDIYSCENQNGSWAEPVPLPGIINSSFEEKSISITKDEQTLYFTSNRPGGFGGTDIYKATKDKKGEWSNVKNLGPVINTQFNEDAPFIDRSDDITLYFSSQGHKGMGEFDVFRATFNVATNEWSEPVNLGYPINTPDDDVYFVASTDGKRAYYSSVREDGMGYTDIYLITVPEGLKETNPVASKDPVKQPVKQQPKEQPKELPKEQPKEQSIKEQPKKEVKPLRYIVKVIDANGKPLEAKVRLQGLVASTSTSGNYEFRITSPVARDYRLSIEKENYIFENLNVRLAGAGTEEKVINKTITLRKLLVGVTSILRNIYFDFNKATFKSESYHELNKLETMMKQNPRLRVEISGHTDSVGPDRYNLFLSRKRAEAVKDFLTSKGIDTRRVRPAGYGETKPLASNDDETEGRQYNRRVEFKVLGN